MRKPRKLQPPAAPRGAKTQTDWRKLMIKVINRAKLVNDQRLPKLLEAQSQGTSEACLRRMSVICDADILREFPDSKT